MAGGKDAASWAFGVYDLGLDGAAVWQLTLRQLDALAERHWAAERAADRRAGEIVAMLYNANRDSKKDPKGATWLDFYPVAPAAGRAE